MSAFTCPHHCVLREQSGQSDRHQLVVRRLFHNCLLISICTVPVSRKIRRTAPGSKAPSLVLSKKVSLVRVLPQRLNQITLVISFAKKALTRAHSWCQLWVFSREMEIGHIPRLVWLPSHTNLFYGKVIKGCQPIKIAR